MWKFELKNTALFLIPLILISPSINLGSYGILYTDILIIVIGLLLIIRDYNRMKSFFFVFIFLFTLGWIGSNIWGLIRYNISLQLAELNHIYRILFLYCAFIIGYKSNYTIEHIISTKLMRFCIFFLGAFILVYFLVDGHTRSIMMALYTNDDVDIYYKGFPGLNSNTNIFSYIIFITTVFYFHFLLRGNKKLLLPSLIMLFIIFAGLSRKNIAFLFGYIIIVLIYTFFIREKSRILKKGKIKVKRALILTIIIITVLFAGIKFVNSPQGTRIIASFKILFFNNKETDELRARYNISSDFKTRSRFMQMGIERIKMAPVFGVPKIRKQEDKNPVLMFHKAHNEFIVIWMYYGILGIISFLVLFGYLIYHNLKKRTYIWVYLYITLFLQAFFDTAFFSYHLCSVLFIFIGLNFNSIGEKDERQIKSELDKPDSDIPVE